MTRVLTTPLSRAELFRSVSRAAVAATLFTAGVGCAEGEAPSFDPATEVASATTSALTATSPTTATVSVYTRWAQGYCANVTVKNTSASTISSWSARLDIGNTTVNNNWNDTVAKSGTILTLGNVGYNGTLAAQASTVVGYCVQGTAPIPDPKVVTDGGGTTGLVWPNATSSANSDPWLMAHHDEITEMHPRALIINFSNISTPAEVRARWDLMVKAMAEGSRYHGYSDANAKPFMLHELLKQVDLIDSPVPAQFPKNSSLLPRVTTSDGVRIDYTQLFSQQFADRYAIPDPQNPSHNLTLCELLQKGVMNELFLAIDNSENGIAPEIIEYKQKYDSNDQPLPGQFDPYAGNGAFSPDADLPVMRACGRSLRVDFLEMNNGLDGALHVLSHNYEHLGNAVPNVERFYAALFNRDWGTRFGTFFNSWYDISVNGSNTSFVSYPTSTSASWFCPADTWCAGQSGTISPFSQGCGNTHYPPNARNSYDYQNTTTVLTRCEHYGLHDGAGGKDILTPYSVQTLSTLTQQFGNGPNGGAWQLYLFQSIPGFGSRATTDDGVHIKNFWPYLYY